MIDKGDILIVEDTHASLKLLIDILTKEGYRVRPADSGELALSSVAVKKPDLILLDIRMQGMDGFEVFRKLKEQENSQDIPVIFLSAITEIDKRVEGLKLGAVDFISKPFQSEELLARVRTHVELRRLRVRLEQQAAELQKSEQRYRSLFENMLEGFAYCKMLYDEKNQPVDFIYLEVNGSFEQLTGLRDVVGKLVSEVIPGIRTLSPELFESYGRVALTGIPEKFEFDLKLLNMWLSISVYCPEKGYFVAVFDNITERKLAEEQIRRNESRLRSLVNILQYNARTTQEFLDYALDESIKLTESKIGYIYFYHENRKQFVLNTWSKDVMKECSIVEPQTCYDLDKTGIWGEAVRQRKTIILNDFQADHPLKKGYPEGHAHLAKYMTVPIFKKDKIIAVVAVANKESDYDETDELQLSLLMDTVWNAVDFKKAEEALRESEEKFRTFFENSSSAMAIIEKDTTISMVNKEYCKIGRFEEKDVIGTSWTKQIPPQDLERLKEYNRKRLIDPKSAPDHYEFSFYRKDGTIRNSLMSVAIIPTNQKIVCSFTDITERKQAENALQEAATEREKLIQELQLALENVKTLQGLIPICSSCKKIRDDQGFWNQVEWYISEHTDAKFSHGICPDCAKKLYGDLYDRTIEKKNINNK